MIWVFFFLFLDYQLVFPIIVDHNGSYISHWNSTHSSKDFDSSTKEIHLNITGFNQTFHLLLHTSSNILAPGFKVYYRHGYSNHSNDAEEHSSDCEFKGTLLSYSTEVALSLCGGVVSFFTRSILFFEIKDYFEFFHILVPHFWLQKSYMKQVRAKNICIFFILHMRSKTPWGVWVFLLEIKKKVLLSGF